jgi:2-polyprenyl-3-methyl-5-hydroxy-6-metoxy-1,4-benzoquinol methylase
MDRRGEVFPKAGVNADYYRCSACGFMFTTLLDGWSSDRLRREIYNDDYRKADPDITGARPVVIADLIQKLFGASRKTVSVFDWGSGSGSLAATLREIGFTDVASADPFFSSCQSSQAAGVDLVLSVEVFEHLTGPGDGLSLAQQLLRPDGAVFFTTVLQPTDIEILRADWWYCAPRNGHVSLHTPRSLRTLTDRYGFHFRSINETLHLA